MTLKNKAPANQLDSEVNILDYSNIVFNPKEMDSQARNFNLQVATSEMQSQLQVTPQTWASDMYVVRSQVANKYIQPKFTISETLNNILSALENQGVLLPNVEIEVNGTHHVKIEALMLESVYHSSKRRDVRNLFYDLFDKEGLIVDLRLQPKPDAE